MASKDLKNSKELESPEGDVLKTTENLPESATADQTEEMEIPSGEVIPDIVTETVEEVKVQEPVEEVVAEPAVEAAEEIQEVEVAEPEAQAVESPAVIAEPVAEPEIVVETEPEISAVAEAIDVPVAEDITEPVITGAQEVNTPATEEVITEVLAGEVTVAEVVAEEAPVEAVAEEPSLPVEVPEMEAVVEIGAEEMDKPVEASEIIVNEDIDVKYTTDEVVLPTVSEEESAIDLSGLSQIELVNMLRELVDSEEDGHQVDAIVAAFYQHNREKNDETKQHFLEAGGKEEDFVAEDDPYGNDVRELLKKYKQQKFEQVKRLDAEKEANLQKKYEIIEEIKNLLNKEESINRTFQEFRDLQRKWYEIGQVPQAKMKDLWDTYHFHVENFYDYIKINKELRDLDLKKNLEVKIGICEKTEELLMETSVIKAFNALQKYHEEWRETGPVPSDKKDEIWERFKAATAKINQKHQEYFEKKKLEQKKNLDAKTALCEKAEEISLVSFDTHRDWDEKSRELVELQKVWKTLGFAPKKENNKIYDRFRAACDKFFINKREFYSKNKDIQQTNLQMKIDLCLEAETIKESTDWKKATQQFIDIQKRWKEIGPIPRKSSDAIWKRFRAACDYFFERKAAHFSDIDGEQFENLKLKEKLIEEVENFKADDDPATALRNLRDLQRRWTEIGHVPLKSKDAIQHRFREAINKQFDELKIDNGNRTSFNFRNKIESMTDNARGLSKVRSEREKYMMKLKQLETDLTLLDNNIGFFANSKNAQALIADVNQKIVDTREKIEQLKEKIRIIDDLDKSEY